MCRDSESKRIYSGKINKNANKKNKIPGVLCARDFLLYRKLLSCKILCIAQRVAGHGVNSNMLKMFCFICEKILAPDDNVW